MEVHELPPLSPLERGGILVAIDGIDGAGKTTQAGMLRDRLAAAGFDVVLTKEPTRGPHGQRVRESAHTGRLPPEEELEEFIADRREHVATLINPALAAGKVVIADRYYFSTAAYQGARGMDADAILRLNETFAPQPDLLALLRLSPAASRKRIRARGDGNGNAFEGRDDLEACARIFDAMSRPYLLRLDGGKTREVTHGEIVRALDTGPIFQRLCHRIPLAACEPILCEFRLQNLCHYPGLGKHLLRPNPQLPMAEINRITEGPGSTEEKMEAISRLLADRP